MMPQPPQPTLTELRIQRDAAYQLYVTLDNTDRLGPRGLQELSDARSEYYRLCALVREAEARAALGVA
jgi:hypothetical protein